MHLPDDFGLSPVRTLAHVGDLTPSHLHQHFWTLWSGAVFGSQPRLRARAGKELDASDPSADHEFESLQHVRIGCRLSMPPKGTRAVGGVVVLHGYERPPPVGVDAERFAPLTMRGLAVLCVRVRGYAGSRLDVPAWTDDPAGYIAHGLASFHGKADGLLDWSIPRAVADAANACRALRAMLGNGAPIALSGPSFGGGLATIAAAQLSAKEEIARLSISLPSLGDWKWRGAHEAPPGSAGRQAAIAINDIARGEPEREQQMHEALRVCDALIHAAKVRCPALGMLAERDETVPAPTAAGLFNALAADPGFKWRFVVPAGHHDSGLRNARRHALFQRCELDFLDLGRGVFEAMAPWEPLLGSGERPPKENQP